jgi:hypothetical protein
MEYFHTCPGIPRLRLLISAAQCGGHLEGAANRTRREQLRAEGHTFDGALSLTTPNRRSVAGRNALSPKRRFSVGCAHP